MPFVFAMCMTPAGGDLHIGGYDTSYAVNNAIYWEPFDPTWWGYRIGMGGINVQGQSAIPLDASMPYVMLDSGTTPTYLNTSVFNALVNQIAAACPSCDLRPFQNPNTFYSDVNPNNYPPVVITFTNVILTLAGPGYIIQDPSYPGYYGSAFMPQDLVAGDGRMMTMGVYTFLSFYHVYNIQTNSIGFGVANSNCQGALDVNQPPASVSPSASQPPSTSGGGITPVNTPGAVTPPPSSAGNANAVPSAPIPMAPPTTPVPPAANCILGLLCFPAPPPATPPPPGVCFLGLDCPPVTPPVAPPTDTPQAPQAPQSYGLVGTVNSVPNAAPVVTALNLVVIVATLISVIATLL